MRENLFIPLINIFAFGNLFIQSRFFLEVKSEDDE